MPEIDEAELAKLKEQAAAAATAQQEAEKWKALSRKNEEQAKENADKAKKFDDLEQQQQSSKSETEQLAARLEKAEKQLAERDAKEATQKMLADVAKEKDLASRGLSAELLRGSTKEEIEAHADALLAAIPAKPAAPSADGQGNNGEPIGEGELSAADIVKAATGR